MPDWLIMLITGGGLGFIQYLISRHDTKSDRIKELGEKIDTGLKDREDTGRERYEEHKEAIEELRQAMVDSAADDNEVKVYIQAIAELVVGLGQDKLVYLTDKYRKRGGITLKERACLEAIYIPYHDKLDGNGYGKMGYEYCMKNLPVISDEEAIEKDKEVFSNA